MLLAFSTVVCSDESIGIVGIRYQQSCDERRVALMLVEDEDGREGVICRHDTEEDTSVIDQYDNIYFVERFQVKDDGQADCTGGIKTRRGARKSSEASAWVVGWSPEGRRGWVGEPNVATVSPFAPIVQAQYVTSPSAFFSLFSLFLSRVPAIRTLQTTSLEVARPRAR